MPLKLTKLTEYLRSYVVKGTPPGTPQDTRFKINQRARFFYMITD